MLWRISLTILYWLFLVVAAMLVVAIALVSIESDTSVVLQEAIATATSVVAAVPFFVERPVLASAIVSVLVILLGLGVGVQQNTVLWRLHGAFADVSKGDLSRKIERKALGLAGDVYEDFNSMVRLVRKKITMEKYVSDSTNKMINELQTGQFSSEARRSNIAILFSDVRGFTSYAEKNDPMIVVDTLNTLFDIQVEAVVENNGDIDKFIGDEVMATFEDAQDAYRASVEIQKKIAAFNKHRTKPLETGIGIHYGEAVIGAVGSGNFYNWTAIGNTVNVAQRLCSAALGGQTLISASCFKKIKTSRKHETKELRVKGIKRRVPVCVFSN
ncbi:MAG: adenylate/guanylate cyclase domain-containing protein [Spirochaetales bacterium]